MRFSLNYEEEAVAYGLRTEAPLFKLCQWESDIPAATYQASSLIRVILGTVRTRTEARSTTKSSLNSR